MKNSNKDLGCSLNSRLEGMEGTLKSYLEDFNIDGVNFLLDDPNLGLMIAVMVTSIKYPEEEPRETGICSRQGKFCYVYNFTMPDFSELGYCFFKQDRNYNIVRQG